MKDLVKKLFDENGATLVESLISIVLLTSIIMPLIWYFMGSTNVQYMNESGNVERFMYKQLINEVIIEDSIQIDSRMYYVKNEQIEEYSVITLFNKLGTKVYEKTFIK